MNATDRMEILKGILNTKDSLNEEKKGVNNEIGSIRLDLREAVLDEDSKADLRKMIRSEIKKTGYRKFVNSKINDLDSKMHDVIMGNGEYDYSQLTFFDVPSVKKEYANMPPEERKNIPDDSGNEDDENPKLEAKKKGKKK